MITNLSDLLRYQNMLCRYDTMALKSLDIFSVHGFPVGLIQCESNLLGIANGGGVSVGSGGWNNIVEKYLKANWIRNLAGKDTSAFTPPTTRNVDEMTGNITMERGLDHFT